MQQITGNNGKVLGFYREEYEKRFIHDAHYNALGYYSRDFHMTFLMNGSPVGNGDLTGTLLPNNG
jgi:hypothetical protein